MAIREGIDTVLLAQVCQELSGSSMELVLFRNGCSPAQIMARIRKYMAKDLGAAKAAATDLGPGFSRFEPVLDFFTRKAKQP